MARYYRSAKDMATRDQMSQAIIREVQAGRGIKGGVYLDVSGVDHELRRVKYRHLTKTMRRLGKDFGNDAVIVRPVAHHSMGGIVVNESMESEVKGLFAAGEAMGGTHGANRLSGNALAECVVSGALSGAAAARFAAENEMPRDPSDAEVVATLPSPKFQEEGQDAASLRRNLKKLMWEQSGILRTGEGLEYALEELRRMRECLDRGNLRRPARQIQYYDLKSMLVAAEAVVRSALVREESRGAHYREDFPDQDDANWLGTVFTKKKGRDLESWFESRAADGK